MKTQDQPAGAPGVKLLGYVCAALIAAMAVMMAIQVIGRYAMQDPPGWTEELARVTFVYATFFGAALAVVRRAHLGIDLITSQLSARSNAIFQIVWRLLACALMATVVYYGYALTVRLSGQPLTSVPVSKGFMFAAVPAGCLLILFYELLRVRYHLRYLRDGSDPDEEHQIGARARRLTPPPED